MLKRAIVALLTTISVGLTQANAESSYFIQITSNPNKLYVDEGESPGGVEIFKDDKFVACALAFTIETWNGELMAPFSYGFISKYPLKELTFKPRGALTRAELIKKETPTTE